MRSWSQVSKQVLWCCFFIFILFLYFVRIFNEYPIVVHHNILKISVYCVCSKCVSLHLQKNSILLNIYCQGLDDWWRSMQYTHLSQMTAVINAAKIRFEHIHAWSSKNIMVLCNCGSYKGPLYLKQDYDNITSKELCPSIHRAYFTGTVAIWR